MTDVLSIAQFYQHGQFTLMGLNIAFLLFNLCLDVALIDGMKGKVLAVFQLQQVVEAMESLKKDRQTENFVRSKKVDAVCRSLPSIVLQLYGVLVELPSLGARGLLIIVLSVTLGITGSAMTLGSLAAKAGDKMISWAFVVHFYYYVCELTMRVVSMSLLFISIGPIAFAVLAVDFLCRLLDAWGLAKKKLSFGVVITALLLFGSDAVNGPDISTLVSSSTGSSVILLISLCLANLLITPTLNVLRHHPGKPIQMITIMACVTWLFKYLIGFYIDRTTFTSPPAKSDEKQEPENPMHHRRDSLNVSWDATYGVGTDRIPKSLQSSVQMSPKVSVKVMNDNLWRSSLSEAV